MVRNALTSNTTGSGNAAMGFEALTNNTAGRKQYRRGFRRTLLQYHRFGDTAVGLDALYGGALQHITPHWGCSASGYTPPVD